jgi:hypothetical protein
MYQKTCHLILRMPDTPDLGKSIFWFLCHTNYRNTPTICWWVHLQQKILSLLLKKYIFNIFIFHFSIHILLDLQLSVQSVPITTKVVSLNPVPGEVYSIQHYVINFVSDLRQVSGFLRILWFQPPLKLTHPLNMAVVLLLSESCAIINDLSVILHSLMLLFLGVYGVY